MSPSKDKQKLLREKLNLLIRLADPARVFADLSWNNQAAWERAMTNKSLAVPLGLTSDGEKFDADELQRLSGQLTRILSGERLISQVQLLSLARYARLDRFLGGEEEAARCLTDDVPIGEFQRRLFDSGWARAEGAEHALYASRQLMLEALGEFGLRRDGIQVGTDLVVTAQRSGPTRGARFPQWGDADLNLVEFPVSSRLKIRLDGLGDDDRACGIVLLELRPAPETPHGYRLSCLAPSPLVPERILPGESVILPTHSLHGVDSFVVDQLIGRHDWLAILTAEPLSLPWQVPITSFYEPSPRQLGMFMNELKLARSKGLTTEVRHFPFRIVNHTRS